MLYQVICELNNPGKDYSEMFLHLENDFDSIRVLHNVWWIHFRDNPNYDTKNRIKEILNDYLENDDLFYISRLQRNDVGGKLSRLVWDWFRNHLNEENR